MFGLPLRPPVEAAFQSVTSARESFNNALISARNAALEAEKIASTVVEIAGVCTFLASITGIGAPVATILGGVTAAAFKAEKVANAVLKTVKGLNDGPYHELGTTIDFIWDSGLMPTDYKQKIAAAQNGIMTLLDGVHLIIKAALP